MKFLAAPGVCVWELTLACNARCIHCGSDAGRQRPRELTHQEALQLCDELARLGVGAVTLSGGEPTLRKGWEELATRLVAAGVPVDMISNGLTLGPETARAAKRAGLASVTLSVDGPEAVHDELRGVQGSFAAVMRAAAELASAGLPVGAATQISTRNLASLPQLEERLTGAGFSGWQLQLTDQLGRCKEHPELALPPDAVPDIIQFIIAVADKGRLPAYGADNIGWMLPCEPLLRSMRRPTDRFFTGCHAGLSVIGITSEGTVRGCLSMPPAFDEASVRDMPLEAIWRDPSRFAYNRAFREGDLTGACKSCAFCRVCRAGCKSLAWAATGGVTCNPYCARLS
ncbi:MAG: radical SAM protein [Deltaproteobacteria bacterium]|nr:radical SAM protein [Deltaproteobacteria bacterium]